MNLSFDPSRASSYKNKSQKIRVLTEDWVLNNIYCPRCGYPKMQHFPNNQAVADYFCPNCQNEYELKSKNGSIGKKIIDGAYDTFIERITSNNNPDFFILSYNAEKMCVKDLWVIPKHFFIPEIIERRKPLADTAKRAGWIGCNILFDQIPVQGQIEMIKNSIPISKGTVIKNMLRASSLQIQNLEARGWLLDVLSCVNSIQKNHFMLEDVYKFEDQLAKRHPLNHNIKPKIRQQLQVLRDKEFITFLGNGHYRKKNEL